MDMANVTNKTQTALDRFIGETRDLFAREADEERRWEALSPILAELIADPDVIAASKRWPDCELVDNRVDNLLFYEDPDYRFTVVGFVVNENGLRPAAPRAHDHGRLYTLYGLMDGHQRIERYERVDDGSRQDYAEVRKVSDHESAPGEIDLVRPFEIHAEDTLGERAVAVIVRSEKSGSAPQGVYHFNDNRYSVSYGPLLKPHAFY